MIKRHPDQELLVLLLKKKGTGETMGKHLSSEELAGLSALFASPNAHLTTKATLWTAMTMLTQTDDEKSWFVNFSRKNLPIELSFFWEPPKTAFQEMCLRSVSGVNLTRQESKMAALSLIDPIVPDHEKAVLLEALRLKRETLDENLGFLDGLWESARHVSANVPLLIDLSVSYDGFSRTPLLVPFCAPILASLGYPVVMHGVMGLGPKYGQTIASVLQTAGKKPQSLTSVVADLEMTDIGWGYVDQSESNPALYGLLAMRNHMVKRPLLATLEKLLLPIHATDKTYLVTGYTHPPYRPLLATFCESLPVSGALILRGVEGSIQPPLDRRFPVSIWTKEACVDSFFRASDLGVQEYALSDGVSLLDKDVVNYGVDALCGKPGFAYDTLVLMTTSVLMGLGLMSQNEAVMAVEKSLKSGHSLSHWMCKK